MKFNQKLMICFLVCHTVAVAQQGHLLFHHLQVQTGLSQPDNAYVYKDSRGFVWISSISGLNRFDGTTMKVYMPDATDPRSLYSENIQSNFFEDRDRNLWFCNYDGMQMYDWDRDCFDFYAANFFDEQKIGYHIFHQDSLQNLWVIVQDSFLCTFRLPEKEFHVVANVHRVTSRGVALTDSTGRVKEVWLYHKGGLGLVKIQLAEENRVASQTTMLNDKDFKSLVRKIVIRYNNEVWVLGNDVMYRFLENEQKPQRIPIEIPDPACLEWMNDSILLIGFIKQGLWEFNAQTLQFTFQYTSRRGDNLSLQNNSIQYLNRDRDSGIWVSLRGIGISYAYPQKKKFETFSPFADRQEEKDFVPVSLIPLDENTLWCATYAEGVHTIHRDGPFQTITPIQGLEPESVPGQLAHVFQDLKKNIWLSSYQKFMVVDPENNVIHRTADTSKIFFYSGVPMSNGDVLLSLPSVPLQRATIDGKKKGVVLKTLPTKPDLSLFYPMWLDHHGRLWLNDNLQGFVVMDTLVFKPLATIPLHGLSYKMIESADGGTIWISSSTGLYKINSDELRIETWYNENQGMPSSSLTAIEKDEEGKLWIAFTKGILRFDPITNHCRIYSEHDGLSPYEYKDVSYRFSDGEMWFGATGAITRFYPDQIRDIQVKAIPKITEIRVNDAPIEKGIACELTGTTNISEIKKLSFRHRENTLSFRVHALEYSAPEQNKVRYKMEGFDDHEIDVANGSLVRYPNMPAGNYHFILYAYNSDGVMNPVPQDLHIIMIPPFYKTWWFITLMVLLGGGILGYIIYLRFSKVVELQRVRLKLYENLHDDVGSRLTAMVMSIEDLERNRERSPYRLESIAQIAKSVVGNMRRLVWAIDPENDKMNSIIQKITYDQSMMNNKESAFQIEANEYTRNLAVPGELRYQISSICTEALNNIAKYAKATEIKIRIHAEKNRINLTITDNGIGFNPDEKTKDLTTGSGYGLNNMRRRAARVKGSLVIHSKPGDGTRIEAIFPY
jgi:ligand-binding sensor domain-containing protein/anti-sigma regulatory factor (Ser/Thr protein kinase)